MVVENQHFKSTAGDSVALEISITRDSVALDITNLDIEFLLGSNELQCNSSTVALLWKRSSVGISEVEKTDPTGGIAVVKLRTADTDALCGGYSWVVKIVNGLEKKTATSGTATIKPKLGDPS